MTDQANKTPDANLESRAQAAQNPRRPLAGRGWRRLFVAGVVSIALFFASLLGLDQYRSHVAEKALQDAIAEADRLDPGWRLAELEAKRAVIPVAQNAESHVHKAGSTGIATLKVGTYGADLHKIALELETLAPMVRLTERQTTLLRAALAPLATPLADSRKIADYPNGRYPFNTSPPISYSERHLDYVRTVSWLLTHEGVLRIQDKDGGSAWVCCRAIQNAARSFGDEPCLATQWMRASYGAFAIRLMERTLAQVSVSEDDLAGGQKLLQEEFKHPALLISLRASRAYWHNNFTQVEAGKISAAELKSVAVTGKWGSPGFDEEVRGYFARHEVKPAHAWLLQHTTQAVELAKRPGTDTDAALRKHTAMVADAPELARPFAPTSFLFTHLQSSRALVGCACIALAAERWRLQKDHWPKTLDDLVAARLLDAVPADPYDGKPMRYRATKDGIVIYSSGPHGNASGAALDDDPLSGDIMRPEFRLWDAGNAETP